MKEKGYMKISELSSRSGVPRSTIHFYLREGILHPPVKTGKTMAYYDESHLRRLDDIKRLKMDMRVPVVFLKKELEKLDGGEGGTRPADDPSPGSPATDPKDAKRRGIVRAAILVFSKKGYHHTKIADIVEEVGISTGTFYIYFNNKRELFIEVVDDVIRNIIGDAARAIKEEQDLRKRLEIRGRTFYDNYTRYSEILNQLRAEMAGDDEWPQEKIKRIYKDLTEPVIREAREAISLGLIRDLDPDLLAFAMTGLIEMMSFRISLDDKYTIDDVIVFIANLLETSLTVGSGA